MKNKTVVVVVAVLLLIVAGAAIKSIYTVKGLGEELLRVSDINDWRSNTNSPIEGIVNIGGGLYHILTTHNVPLKNLEVRSQLCDCGAPSLSVTNSIIVISPNSKLCIRLRYDMFLGKYHIIGYRGSIE